MLEQTDLVASLGTDTYLVETKWTKTKSDVDAVDALRIRLQKTHAPVVGVLVSVAGFTKGALKQVRAERDRPVLLVTGAELESVLDWPQGIRALLRDKHRDLVVDGVVRLDRAPDGPSTGGRPVDLPGSISIARVGGESMPSIVGSGDFEPVVFVGDIPDVDWVPGGGRAVTLDLPLRVDDQAGLIDVLAQLTARGWTTERGRWAIQQAHTNWHGLGCRELGDALEGWVDRYALVEADLHHTEQVVYFDAVDGALYTLSVDVRAETRLVDHCNLSFQFIGTPLDNAPVLELARAFNIEQHLYFRSMSSDAVTGYRVRRGEMVDLEPLGLIVEDDRFGDEGDQVATGVIVRNPYLTAEQVPSWWPPEVAESELLVCFLRSWHTAKEPRQAYHLWMLEWTRTSDAFVFRPVVDWDWKDAPGGEPPRDTAPRTRRTKR